MERLGLGMLVLICAVLLGCAQAGTTSISPQAEPVQQPDKTGGGGGDMH
jgi:hypothetical protein